MELIPTPQDNIEAFLINDFNIDVYENLIYENSINFIFDPIDFFNFLYSEYDFFCINSNNYIKIKEHFDDFKIPLNYNYDQIKFLLFSLINLIKTDYNHNDKIAIKSYLYISDITEKMCFGMFPLLSKQITKYEFEIHKTYIDLEFNNSIEKIKYLIEIKTEYLQEQPLIVDIDFNSKLSFDKKCDLEIQKLEKTLELEKNTPTSPKETAPEPQQINNTLQWNGTELQFTELTKALYETKLISPEIKTQKEFFNRMKQFFNVNDFNENDKIRDIVERSNESPKFIYLLETTLNNYISKTLEKRKNRY